MKRTVFTAWVLAAIIFGLGFFSLAKHGVFSQEKKITAVPDPGVSDSAVMICAKIDGTVVEMNMDEYLQGVLRAEMPASFEQEALKAQAVAARTETFYKIENGPSSKHPEADICNDINCCQAFKSVEAAHKAWGKDVEKYDAKIATAVRETDGMTILYGDKPILAAFFSAASGQTNQSGDVWLQNLPYLQSVKSPEGEGEVPDYYSLKTFTEEEFKQILLAEYPEAKLEGAPEKWFGKVEKNDSDMVISMEIGGIAIKGTKLRSMFSLRSAAFTVSAKKGNIIFHVTGYGHGVGMSQYGANVMAKEGKGYQDILKWYYTDVRIGTYTPKTLAVRG